MTYVVTDNCSQCRYTECVSVCPVECFHADGDQLYIDPNVCIDCGACSPICPVEAIFEQGNVPESKKEWIEINAVRSAVLPVISAGQPPLATAEAKRAELGY